MGDSDVKEFHTVPRISASRMDRIVACGAAFPRSVEMHQFAQTFEIVEVSDNDANKGRGMHALLATIPFLNAFEPGPVEDAKAPHARVLNAAERMGYRFESRDDELFCVNAIHRRDRLINHVIQDIKPENVQSVVVDLDTKRLFARFADDEHQVEVSGLPDVCARILRKDGRTTLVICDYKSLYLDYQHTSMDSKQLATLAACARAEDPTVDHVYVALITPSQPANVFDVAVCTEAELQTLLDRLGVIAITADREARELKSELIANDGRLSESRQNHIDSLAVVGNHCLFCEGKVCCGKLHRTLGQLQTTIKALPLADTSVDTMTPEKLTETFIKVNEIAKQFELLSKLEHALKTAISQMSSTLEGRGESLPGGIRLIPGMPQARWREEIMDTNPSTIFELLAPAIEAACGETPDYEVFLSTCCDVTPSKCITNLADLAGVDRNEVFTRLLLPLGENNPFEMHADPQIIIQKHKANV